MNSKIKQAKNVSMVNVLSHYGHNPVKQSGNEIAYLSPFGSEKTPSFMVNIRKNVFNDFSSGENGDVISLLMLLEPLRFHDAIEKALSFDMAIPIAFEKPMTVKSSKLQITSVIPIQNSYLIDYLESRKISIALGRIWLDEIHFTNKGKRYFALGFKNDSGGYELRNGVGFKAKTKNGITSIEKGTESVSIFEGFFDFLSALEYYGIKKPNNTTYVLNTTANYSQLIAKISNVNKIYCFLDNDKSGKNLIQRLIKDGFNTIDMSDKLYQNSKDFNDYWSNKRQ